jgi:hypothetical protein
MSRHLNVPIRVVLRAVFGLIAGGAFTPQVVLAQFDLAVERKLLVELLEEGNYRQAVAEARRVEAAIKPQKKNVWLGPLTPVYAELLIYRGSIERRMGNLDDAEKTLTMAYNMVSEPGFQQLVMAAAPRDDGEEQGRYWLPLELTYLRLLDNSTELLFQRVRAANDARLVGREAASREQVDTWFKQIDTLIRMSIASRRSLRGRLSDEEDDPLARSALARMMITQARPRRFAGMRLLEASKLPWTLPGDSTAVGEARDAAEDGDAANTQPTVEPPAYPPAEDTAERKMQADSQRRRANNYLEEATALGAAAADAALAAFKDRDKEAAQASPEFDLARREAALVRAEPLVPLAEAEMLAGDLKAARGHLDAGLADLESAGLENHPDIALPLMLSAELALRESKAAFDAREPLAAKQAAKRAVDSLQAAKQLLEAEDSQYDPASPLHTLLADLISGSRTQEQKSTQVLAATDAADAAARKALAALSKGDAKKAKPKAPPAAGPADPPGK